MQNPKNKKSVNPAFKAGFNIQQRIAMDEKMRNYSEYAAK
jgi:hypothetical protein